MLDPSLPATSNFAWSVDGSAISNYVVATDSSSAQVLPLAQTNSSTVNFYWVSGGQQNVSCTVVLPNGMKATGKAGFNVQKPTVNSFTSTTGPIVVGNAWTDLELSCGTPSTVGIIYTAQITAPAAVGGQLKFTQTTNGDFQRTHTNNVTDSLVVPAWWLDNHDPYGGQGHGPYNIVAGMQLSMSDNDSPGVPLQIGFKTMDAIIDDFGLYLMFKPSGNSIWVPLSKINWGWSGIAQSSDGGVTWTKASGAQDVTNPSGANTTNFPEWSSVFKNGQYPPWHQDP